jgi:hypothetical protein
LGQHSGGDRAAGSAYSGDLPSGTSIKEAGVGICNKPGNGWAVVLRRRPARIVEDQPEGSYASAFEIICCYCGDHPYLDYCEVAPELQRVRGPYPIVAGVAAYEEHLGLHQEPADGSRIGRPAHGSQLR